MRRQRQEGGLMVAFGRIALAVVLLLFPAAAARANAQTVRLGVHTNYVGKSGVVRVVSGAVGACFLNNSCTYFVNKGATVRLAADYPGRFSAGSGPAAA